MVLFEIEMKLRKLRLILYYGFARFLPATNIAGGIGGIFHVRFIRRIICKGLFKTAGMNINIERGAIFGDGSLVEIGDNSGLGVNCFLDGPCKIGNNVMMGPDVIILTSNHRFDNIDIPMILQGNTPSKPVLINDDVWIGARAIILPGVTVGKGSVVGAGAVMTKDVPRYVIVAGNPAKIIRYRA